MALVVQKWLKIGSAVAAVVAMAAMAAVVPVAAWRLTLKFYCETSQYLYQLNLIIKP